MLETIVSLLTFLAGFFAVCALNLIITDMYEKDRKESEKRREELRRIEQRERARQSAVTGQSTSLGNLAATAAKETSEKQTFVDRVQQMLDQSGVRWSLTRLALTSMGLGLGVGGVAYLAFGTPMYPLAIGLVASLLPVFYIQRKRQVRLEKLRHQLPDSLELMSRIMRSGQTITQAMQSVATEFKAPISTEFGYCYEQQNLGLAPELALRDLNRRTGLLEIKILVLALLVHRQSGGNLAELLDKLATMVRERFRIRGKIRSLTAEGRLQAVMLIGLPPVMFGLLMLVNRTYAIKLFDHPELIMATLGSTAIGAFFIHKIVNFDF